MSDPFIASLARQHAAVDRFLSLLQQEHAVLAQSPVAVDELSTLTERKTALAAELQALDETRQARLAERGYETDRSGAEQLCRELGCETQWRAFMSRVDEASTQNRVNGLLVNNKLDLSEQLLDFLQKTAADSLYDPSGQKRGFGGKSIHREA